MSKVKKIINSMSPSEKRGFLKSLDSNKSIEHKLFKFIESESYLSPSSIIKKFPGTKQIRVNSNQLYNKILSFLSKKDFKLDTISYIEDKIKYAEILIQRKLFKTAWKEVELAEKKASLFCQHEMLVKILRYKLSILLVSKNNFFTTSQQVEQEIEQQVGNVNLLSQLEISYYQLSRIQRLKNAATDEELNEIIEFLLRIEKDVRSSESFIILVKWHKNNMLVNKLNKVWELVKLHSESIQELFYKHPQFIEFDNLYLIHSKVAILASLATLDRIDEAKIRLNEFEKFVEEYPKLKLSLYQYSHNFIVYIKSRNETEEMQSKILLENDSLIANLLRHFTIEATILYCINMSLRYYEIRDLDNVIALLNKCINIKNNGIRNDSIAFAYLFRLITFMKWESMILFQKTIKK